MSKLKHPDVEVNVWDGLGYSWSVQNVFRELQHNPAISADERMEILAEMTAARNDRERIDLLKRHVRVKE